MSESDSQKYEIFRRLALAGAASSDSRTGVEEALKLASSLVGLASAAAIVWDDHHKVKLNVSFADSDDTARRLGDLEDHLFSRLRADHELEAAYMSFAGELPCHTFTLPMKHAGRTFGALIGIQTGPRTILGEELFLDAFSAAVAAQFAALEVAGAVGVEEINRERHKAIIETAVTVNHEINNPLTAILGNVQLLLLKRGDLDDELKAKLKVIEESASRIREVTQKLMQLTSARSTEYTEGTTMIDLSSDEDKDS